MNIQETGLSGAYLISLSLLEDERGGFARTFCAKELEKIGVEFSPVQGNHSFNKKAGTIRGMHFQHPPFQESKLIRCIAGSVLDVIVDLRQGSPTFLKSERLLLSQKNMHSVLVPPGFAHGFQTLEDNTELLYLHSAFYEPSAEGGLHYNDPLLAIDWPLIVSSISVRDQHHLFISENFEGIKL